MNSGFSIWLMPPPAVHARFAGLIDALARRLGTPRFEPHITLAGTPEALGEDEAIARATALAARLVPVPVRLLDVAYTDAYFRCLYVRAEPTPALLAAHRIAAEQIASAPVKDFMPHLSLVYGNLPSEEKERLIDEIGRRFDAEFVAGHVSVCLAAGRPDEGWRLRGPFALTGPAAS